MIGVIALEAGQVWEPADHKGPRKVEAVRAAGMSDRYWMGTIIVKWSSETYEGICSQRAFRRWIKHTEAALQ